jgi:hypothetical protein
MSVERCFDIYSVSDIESFFTKTESIHEKLQPEKANRPCYFNGIDCLQ